MGSEGLATGAWLIPKLETLHPKKTNNGFYFTTHMEPSELISRSLYILVLLESPKTRAIRAELHMGGAGRNCWNLQRRSLAVVMDICLLENLI